MADYSTSSANAVTALNNALSGGMVEEYEVGPARERVKRGSVVSQVKAAAMLEGLAARRSQGLCSLAKFTEPRP